ncbi:MAG: hypothetical protein DWQ07_14020 [Chloroflexi bacterium]|nr:MAG: hypothetical protein DWQ07_14020 [Chloroflexota bacterium]
MNRLDHNLSHAWHVALNQYSNENRSLEESESLNWMYEAKSLADEVPRLAILFKLERTGQLPAVHQQCSHAQPEEVKDNHLLCCLGVECRKCPHLLALEQAEVEPEQMDVIKAWTCAGHIVGEAIKGHIDTSEGFLMTVDDRMYWDRVYTSMAGGDWEEEPE